MVCGTPVIAYRRGLVPEVIDDGVTGFVVENEEEASLAMMTVAVMAPSAAVRRRRTPRSRNLCI
jgi:glycosyltransferase involved in cell wall biosynthesis